MKYFKTKKIKYKNKMVITILLNICVSVTIIFYISSALSTKIIDVSDKLVQKENILILKKAFLSEKNDNLETDDLITVIKNSKEEIVEVEFKFAKCKDVLNNIIAYLDLNTKNNNSDGYILYIPLGYITDSPLLSNLGPKIPLKISVTNIAMGNIKTKVQSFGLNNALIEVYVEITLNLDSNLPLNKKETSISYEQLMASKIITGKVPNFYSGELYTKSETISLPLQE